MQYLQITLTITPFDATVRDLMVYALGDEGPYNSFEETPNGVKAYVAVNDYDATFLDNAIADNCCQSTICYQVEQMPDKDWNQEWERQHQPVLVDNFCWVRAPFHPHRHDVPYEIEIEPKMSFGTAHHQTTYMMLSYLRDIEITDQRVLDMGCGTAVLAIMAAMRGAKYVEAIDIDEWAYLNAIENCHRNGCDDIRCRMGDATLIDNSQPFDIILANINRNILLGDMQTYVNALGQNGTLVISGFYAGDVQLLTDHAQQLGLLLAEQRERDGWQALRLIKQK